MRCPACGGSTFEALGPNRLKCTSQALIGVQPQRDPFQATVPIYGVCAQVASAAEWEAAGVAAARNAEAANREREQREDYERTQQSLARRKKELLAKLRSAGSPGTTARRVPGRSKLSVAARVFGRSSTAELVDVAPAWPVGNCAWHHSGMRGSDVFENLLTGITPNGTLVPMAHAGPDEAVEILYRNRRLWDGTYPQPTYGFVPERLYDAKIVPVLEQVAKTAGID